ncbi:unnamed protein product, partial [Nesidiocoris tenuis]
MVVRHPRRPQERAPPLVHRQAQTRNLRSTLDPLLPALSQETIQYRSRTSTRNPL